MWSVHTVGCDSAGNRKGAGTHALTRVSLEDTMLSEGGRHEATQPFTGQGVTEESVAPHCDYATALCTYTVNFMLSELHRNKLFLKATALSSCH